MTNFKTLIAGTTLAFVSLGSLAQAASAPATPRVDKREVRNDARIQQGVGSGRLTAKETHRLEKEQAAITINKAERTPRPTAP